VIGPKMKRPGSDRLGRSAHANMKELHFAAYDGIWHFAHTLGCQEIGKQIASGKSVPTVLFCIIVVDRSGAEMWRIHQKSFHLSPIVA
jgi:hypothetical protein